MTPIFKKGDRNAAENYRTVSLITVLSKTMEHKACHAIHKHVESHKVLATVNHGFRSRFSLETQLTVTIDDIAKHTEKGLHIVVGILDFSKAFDTVPHGALLHKLDASEAI